MSGSEPLEKSEQTKKVNLGPRTVEIPVSWEAARLEEYSEWITQGPNPDYSKGTPAPEYRALKTKDLYDSGVLYDNADEISERTFKNREKYRLQQGDVLIAIVGRGSIGKTYLFEQQPEREYIFTRAIGLVRPQKDGLIPDFLHHYFQSHDAKQHFYQSITGSTGQEVLRTSAVKAMPIPLPPLSEQRRIVDILSTVDVQIQQTEEIIRSVRELKKGLMQDVFIQGLNKEKQKKIQIGPKEYQIPMSWEVVPAEEVCNQITVGVVSGATDHYRDDGVPFLRTKNINENYIDSDDIKYITSEFHRENPNSELQAGDVITARTGDPGTTCVVPPEYDGANCFSLLITRTGNELYEKYFSYFMNSPYTTDFINSRKGGGVQKNLNVKFLRKLPVFLPPLQEQREISSLLDNVDQRYHQEQETKSRLQELKRGLMQDLLTGKVRVNTNN